MKRELLEPYVKGKKKIKLNLLDNRFYTGYIVSIDNEGLVFCDKFGENIPINLDAIAYVLKDGGKKHEADCI